MTLYRSLVTMVLLCVLVPFSYGQHNHDAHEHPAAHQHHDQSYRFIENDGQWPNRVQARADINNGYLWLEKQSMTYHLMDVTPYRKAHGNLKYEHPENEPWVRKHVYRVNFLGAFDNARIEKTEKTPEYYNFFLGKDKSRWKGGVDAYEHITYRDIYEDIHLDIYSKDEFLKYDFTVKSYANPANIRMEFEGVDKISIQKGHLVVETSVATIQEQKPYAYQVIDGNEVKVPCKFKLEDNVVSFHFPKGYDETYDLIIDPVLIFSTYSGSWSDNFGMTATYDDAGNLFSAGTVFGDSFPTTFAGAYDTLFAGTPAPGIVDVILTKYTADGTAQIYSTYLGGDETETPHSLIVNSQNELCMYGVTSSSNFPTTTNAYQDQLMGGSLLDWPFNGTLFASGTDLYVARFSLDGSQLLASTFVGGTANDGVNYIQPNGNVYDSLVFNYGDYFRGEIMVDSLDNIYVASSTRSNDFPIVGGFDNTFNGTQDGVILKLPPDLTALTFSSFVGGAGMDAAYNVKLDDTLNVYITGGTTSNDFITTPGAYSGTYNGGLCDAFIMKINPTASNVINSTFVGTPEYDQSYFMQIDRVGKVFIYGQTAGTGSWPVSAGVYNNPNSGQFISKFSNDLSTLELSTVFGNSNGQVNISPAAFLVDVCGNVYCTGWGGDLFGAALFGMPLSGDAFMDETPPYDGYNFYLIVLERDFNSLIYGSYFGGEQSQEHVDGGTSRFDSDGIVYQSVCAGCGGFSDFPTTQNAWSQTNNAVGRCNNGMFKFDFEVVPLANFTPSDISGCAPLTVTFTNSSSGSDFFWDFGNNDTTSTVLNPVRDFPNPGTYEVWLYVTDSICNLVDSSMQTITVFAVPVITMMNDTTICSGNSLTLDASASGATSYIWSTNNAFTDTLNSPLTNNTATINPTQDGWYYFMAISGSSCSMIDSVFITVSGNAFGTSANSSICIGDLDTLSAFPINPPVNATYSWSPPAGIVSGGNTSTVIVQPDSSTMYYVTITDDVGCTYLDSVYVDVFDFGGMAFGAWADQDTILTGESTVIHADPNNAGFTYTWTPTFGLDDPNAQSTIATPEETTTYIVTVSSGSCSRSGSVTIWVFDEDCGDPDIFVPNAFTPDGDDNNDILYVRGNNIRDMHFVVFDRWGEKVFETFKQSEGWDGTYKGMKADPAVFVYYLEVTCVGEMTFFKKGNVTLIR